MDNKTLVLTLIGLALPLASAAIARQKWSPVLVGILTLLLSSITGLVTEVTNGGPDFDLGSAARSAAIAFVSAAVARLIIWAHPPLDAKLLAFPSKPVDQEQRAA